MEKSLIFRATGEIRKPKYNESYRDAWNIKTAINDVIGLYPIYQRQEITETQARLISCVPEMLEALKLVLTLNGNPRRDCEDEAEWKKIMGNINALITRIEAKEEGR